jgi:short-subunit dehydrogenase
MTDADERKQMNTNYLGPSALIRLVLPGMRKLGRGKIINVSSVSGMLAMPTMASYSASKYALEGMSEALWYEALPLGINVSLIQPGFVRSNSFRRVHYTKKSSPDGLRSNGTYMDYYANMAPFIERLMSWSFATPETIARKILGVVQMERPPLWIPATVDAVLFYYLRRMLPRRLLLPLLFALLPGAKKWGLNYTNCRLRQKSRDQAA